MSIGERQGSKEYIILNKQLMLDLDTTILHAKYYAYLMRVATGVYRVNIEYEMEETCGKLATTNFTSSRLP